MTKLAGPGGWTVHEWWTRTVGIEIDSTPVTVTATVTVNADGKPSLANVAFKPVPLGARLAFDDLLDMFVQLEILQTANQLRTPDVVASYNSLPEDQLGQLERAAATARRKKPTPEFLDKVLRLYDGGGIQAVAAGTGYSESYSFKLLRAARQAAAGKAKS
jgi:hypothetical protein